MTSWNSLRPLRGALLCLSASLLLPGLASAQVTLTGATIFGTNSGGGTNYNQGIEDQFSNTIGGDFWFNLWFALDRDARLPLNGPANAQAPISFPLTAGNTYKYYMFSNCCGLTYTGLNLYFDGASATPNIAVFGLDNQPLFVRDSAPTLSLYGDDTPSKGSTFYSHAGAVAVLTEFIWYGYQPAPLNSCQPQEFYPEPGSQCSYGSLTLQVFPAALLGAATPSGAPFTEFTLRGTGYLPGETVTIYANRIPSSPIGTVTADVAGTFSLRLPVPQEPFGPIDLFGLGISSGYLGATSFSITPSVAASPAVVVPGETITLRGYGFGAGETVSVYLQNPQKLVGTATANALGSLVGPGALSILVPLDAARGANEFYGVGVTTQAIGFGNILVE